MEEKKYYLHNERKDCIEKVDKLRLHVSFTHYLLSRGNTEIYLN